MNITPIKPTSVGKERKGYLHRLKCEVKFGLHKLFGNKLFLIVFFFFALLPILISCILIYYASTNVEIFLSFLRERTGGAGGGGGGGGLSFTQVYVNVVYYALFLSVLGVWTLIAVTFGGAQLVIDEFQARTFKYYYSRPLSRFSYVSGRVLSLLILFFPLVTVPFLIGTTIPLAVFPPLSGMLTMLEVLYILLGGIFSIFLILLFQIMTVFAFSTFGREKFTFLAIILFYASTGGIARVLVSQAGEIFCLLSVYFYLQSIVVILISLLWFGENPIIFPFLSRDLTFTYLGGVLGIVFLFAFTILIRWRLK